MHHTLLTLSGGSIFGHQGINFLACVSARDTTVLKRRAESSAGEAPQEDTSLEEAGRTEHDYVHRRLREELGREPTEEEIDEWLRQHTEGY